MTTANTNRMHVALNVADLERATRFYEDLFGLQPDKVHADHVRFSLDDPPLALTLNLPERLVEGNRLSHLGIRLGDHEALRAAHDRLAHAGHALRVQDGTTCCYALQDKFWVTDPDGNDWEYYVLLSDDPEGGDEPAPTGDGRNPCCDG